MNNPRLELERAEPVLVELSNWERLGAARHHAAVPNPSSRPR
jgi:hypothetical protein